MKKIIIFLILSIWFNFSGIAQTIDGYGNRNIIDNSYNICSYYLVYYELKGHSDSVYFKKFISQIKYSINQIPDTNDISIFITQNDSIRYLKELLYNISDIKEKLSKEKYESETLFIESLLTSIFEKGNNNFKFNNIVNTSSVKEIIRGELKKLFLLSLLREELKQNTPDTVSIIKEKPKTLDEKIADNMLIVLIAIVILFIITFYLINNISQKKSEGYSDNPRVGNENYVTYDMFNNNISKYIEKNNLENIKNEILDKVSKSIDKKLQETKVTIDITPQKPEIRKKYYFPYPENENGFDISKKSDRFIETESIYEVYFENENNARFKFVENENTTKIAQKLDYVYILPACESENAFNMNAKLIKTIEEGEAVKEGNYLKIIKKAKIKYD